MQYKFYQNNYKILNKIEIRTRNVSNQQEYFVKMQFRLADTPIQIFCTLFICFVFDGFL